MQRILSSKDLPRIFGQAEAIANCSPDTAHVVSFLDPGAETATMPLREEARHLVFRFHDVISPLGKCIMASREDVKLLIEFYDGIHQGPYEDVIIHCQHGVSRSTAAAMILLWRYGHLQEAMDSGSLFELRPVFWPNSRMLSLADDLLNAGGGLVAAGLRMRREAYAKCPEFVDSLRATHRATEVMEVEAGAYAPDCQGDNPQKY